MHSVKTLFHVKGKSICHFVIFIPHSIMWIHFCSAKSFVGFIHLKRIMLTVKISNVQSPFTKGLKSTHSFPVQVAGTFVTFKWCKVEEIKRQGYLHFLHYNDIFGSWRVDSVALLLLVVQFWFLAPISGEPDVPVNPGLEVWCTCMPSLCTRYVNGIKADMYIYIHIYLYVCICMW